MVQIYLPYLTKLSILRPKFRTVVEEGRSRKICPLNWETPDSWEQIFYTIVVDGTSRPS